MADIFENTILCRKCDTKMEKTHTYKNGFKLRVAACPKCSDKIVHPSDEHEYKRFMNLRNKEFRVKMRLVGNSYAVSIPREIINFMEQQREIMDDIVRLCFEDFGKLSLNFGKINSDFDLGERKNGR